jgi:ABC-type branched-subunit amino acid transport system substrate-binding protein
MTPRSTRIAACLLALGCHASLCRADILIGQTAGFTGSAASGVAEMTAGARLYLDAVNAQGGVHGEKIQMLSMDDKFEPKLAATNARHLIKEKHVVALFLSRGTPHTQAMVPVLNEARVPLVGPSTGAMALHLPVQPYVFNVRAPYQREAEKAVHHLSTLGINRIVLMRQLDSFGEDAAKGAERAFASIKLQPVHVATFDRDKPDFAAAAKAAATAQAQAVLVIGSAGNVAKATHVLREAGSRAQVVTLSNNASSGFVRQLGGHARGTIVTQVFPNERSLAIPMIKEAKVLASAAGLIDVSPSAVEGFAAAKVLVEALKRCGPKPTPERLVAALNGMSRVDIGGMEISFGPEDHSGLTYADLSIIGSDGRFMR